MKRFLIVLAAFALAFSACNDGITGGKPSALYTISFSGNGNTGGTPPAAITQTGEGAAITLPENTGGLAKTGHTFNGWNTQAGGDGMNYAAGAAYSPSANSTLYAKWVSPPALPIYTMKSISGGTVQTSHAWGLENNYPLPYIQKAFKIGETEISYELWYAVKQRAGNNGYTFANAGREGSSGDDGAAPGGNKTHPVTRVSWRDAVVWCNAYSQTAGKTPVYYADAGFNNVLKLSEDDNTTAGNGGAEKAYIKTDADGFRLPTEAEWEYAARGGVPGKADWGKTYAGSDTAGDVAWYKDNSGGTTHAVRGKAANSAGLYDMSGNVSEWCQDIFSNRFRADRGGTWYGDAFFSAIVHRDVCFPYDRTNFIGFRVVSP